jgi:dihydroorotate dehydrogenase
MPDWFYRTVSRPLLFQLSTTRARDLALGFIGTLARLPLGTAVIDFLGHMRADDRLRQSFQGVTFPTPVGLGPGLDNHAVALPALARFGIGFIEVGPLPVEPPGEAPASQRRVEQQALWVPGPGPGPALPMLGPRLRELSPSGIPLILRLGCRAGTSPQEAAQQCCQLVKELAAHAHLFSLATLHLALSANWSVSQWTDHLHTILPSARPVLLCVPADLDLDRARPFLDAALEAGGVGLLVDGSIRDEQNPAGRLLGRPAYSQALQLVRTLRQQLGSDRLLIASGGIHEPEDALEFHAAGANLVQVDTGLIYSGPGLPKRINDAFLYLFTHSEEDSPSGIRHPPSAIRHPEMTWFWTTLMGAGMLLGSILALLIASTRVVLPYDESFVGMDRQQLEAINSRLVLFMAHDRVSLAGTMVAIGVLYVSLSWLGIRRGLHWAQVAVFVSAFTGFASFFLFLGFGYLDPFHAFVTVVLLQFLLLGVHGRLGCYHPTVPPPLRADPAWQRAQWGQLLLVVHGFALLSAGVVISCLGATHVFVPEDLDYLQTTAETLRLANPRLVPLVAHDRATLGGMLLASGWAFLLPTLWGFRNGSAWLWWSFLSAGVSAYTAAIAVHYVVGYINLRHLLPAYAGLGWFLLGLGLSHTYLTDTGKKEQSRWQRFLPGTGREKNRATGDPPREG